MPREGRQPAKRYRLAPGPDIDLEREEVQDSKGNRITPQYVEEAIENVREHVARGRPPLQPGGPSSAIGVRLPDALRAAVRSRAEQEGKSESEVMRDAIEQYLVR